MTSKTGFYSIAAALAIFTLIGSFLVSDSSETPKALIEFGQPTINNPSDVSEYLLQAKED